MLILLLIIFTIVFFICLGSDIDEIAYFPGFAWLICLIALIWNISTIVDGRVIDQKIEMYTEENKVIETQIETVVSKYMEYESETLTDLKTDSAITLVSLYPELKSDELVKTQIETYQRNRAICF